MFAARFDPTKTYLGEEQRSQPVKSILPLKRAQEDVESEGDHQEDYVNEDDDLEEDDQEENEQVEGKQEGKRSRNDNTAELFDDKNVNAASENNDSDEHATAKSANENSQSIQEEVADTEIEQKHSSVISRFQKTLSLQPSISEFEGVEHDESSDIVPHDLAPIPQPDVIRDDVQKLSFSTNADKSVAWQHTERIHYDNSMIKEFKTYSGEIDGKILGNIDRNFSNKTFPIQTVLLDTILQPLTFAHSVSKKNYPRRCGDILVNASTGSGKTLAYSIPIVQILAKRTVNRLRCLVVVPTKILIHQVYETFVKLSQGSSLIVGISKLENSLAEEHKKFKHQEPDIIITTPGRLVDHLQMDSFSLSNLKFLVLDEADRLLNQSFQNWCQELLTKLKIDKDDDRPGNVMKMIFSATLTTNTEKLHNLRLNKPRLFMMNTVKLYNLPKLLQECNIHIPTAKSSLKPLIILKLLTLLTGKQKRIIIFVRSNESSIRLTRLLQIMVKNGINEGRALKISSINSNNSKGENRRIINEFSACTDESQVNVLIATDLMSRGVDINNITHVVNYDLPISSQQYVHRCGRTARAQTNGIAYNILVGKGERKFWASNIDADLSRDADGFQVKIYGDDENAAKDNDILHIEASVEDTYKKCLQELQKAVLGN